MRRVVSHSFLRVVAVAGLLTVAASAAAASGGRAEIAHPAATPFRGALVFTSTRTGIAQAYGYDLRARSLSQLTFPRWEWLSRGVAGVWAAPNRRQLLVSGDEGVQIVSASAKRTQAGYNFGPLAENPWSPDSQSWLGSQICGPLVVTSADGSWRREVGPLNTRAPAWSPDGRRIAFLHSATCGDAPAGLAVVAAAGGAARDLTPPDPTIGRPAWSPDGRRIAFIRGGVVFAVSPGQTAVHRLSAGGAAEPLRWSTGGRWLAYPRGGRIEIVHPDGTGRRAVSPAVSEAALAWSAAGLLAIADRYGLRVYDPSSRKLRVLDARAAGVPAWAPDSTALAYEVTSTHALRLAPLRGHSRTLHVFAATSALRSLQWVPRAFSGAAPEPVRLLERKVGRDRELRVPVSELAVDGDDVGFLGCGNIVGVWNPVKDSMAYPLPEWARRPLTRYACINPGWESTQTSWLALSRLGVAYSRSAGGNTRAWNLFVGAPSAPDLAVPWHVTTGNPPLAGWAHGDGDLLVFATRDLAYEDGRYRVASETLWRVEQRGYAGSCPAFAWTFRWERKPGPCRELATAPGELPPLDVDSGRVAVRRGDGTVALLDAGDGHTIVATPPAAAPAVDAALAGSDLIVLRRGSLSWYSAATGTLVRTWQLPDVVTSRHCISAEVFASFRSHDDCPRDARATLEDAARGLAAYIVDGRLHVLRLADGHDVDVGAATLARFTASGLAYATAQTGDWPTRLTFVPAAALG